MSLEIFLDVTTSKGASDGKARKHMQLKHVAEAVTWTGILKQCCSPTWQVQLMAK